MVQLTSEILREVGALSRSVHSISDIRFRPLHLQKGQFPFLTRVCEHPGIRQQELSNLLRVDKATTAKAVQKLVQAGYLTVEPDLEDRRSQRILPTLRAEEVYPLLIEEENANLAVCFAGFTPEEQALTVDLVQRMRKNIEAKWFAAKGLGESHRRGGNPHDPHCNGCRSGVHHGNCRKHKGRDAQGG